MTREEAIQNIKRMIGFSNTFDESILTLFPELKESEDERIRKAIMGLTYIDGIEPILTKCSVTAQDIRKYLEKQKINTEGDFGRGYDCGYEACLHSHGAEWLKKQKEQKPISAEEVLVKAGLKPYKDGNQWCILAGDNIQEGICGFGDTIEDALYEFLKEVLDLQKEQKPADVIDPFSNDNFVRGYGSGYADAKREQKPSINIDQLKSLMLQYLQEAANEKDDSDIEADTDKWARKILGYDFEQKPAEWSEEDEEMFDEALAGVLLARNRMNDTGCIGLAERFEKAYKWLESFRPRPHWKPSEEQMEALNKVAFNLVGTGTETDVHLVQLYEQLKKLGVKKEPEYYQHFDPDC